jgi:hypothetical protein
MRQTNKNHIQAESWCQEFTGRHFGANFWTFAYNVVVLVVIGIKTVTAGISIGSGRAQGIILNAANMV